MNVGRWLSDWVVGECIGGYGYGYVGEWVDRCDSVKVIYCINEVVHDNYYSAQASKGVGQ